MVGMPTMILILVIALIVFGPGKLPEVGKALGKGIQEFRKTSNDLMSVTEPIKEAAKLESSKVIDVTAVEHKTESNH